MSLDVGFDAQVPSLPDAGAATSSLGETFSSDLSTGTADFSIPLDTPNGPNDIGPRLTLHYDNSSGNGPFGLGFNLRLPRIVLSLAHGVPRYDAGDTRVLEGAGELLDLGNGTLQPIVDGGAWRIRADGGGYQLMDRTGQIYRLGTSQAARVFDAGSDPSGDATGTFAWHLERIEDALGNAVDFVWERDSNQLYLVRVAYGPYALRFDYEPRPDPLRWGRPGFLITTRRRCQAIALTLPRESQPVLRRWQLGYRQHQINGCSLLSEFTMTGVDADGATISTPTLTLGYSTAASRTLTRMGTADAGAVPGLLQRTGRRVEPIDWFGSGLPDLLEVSDGGRARVWPNLGGLSWGRPLTVGTLPLFSDSDAALGFVDMNGDGIADLVRTDRAFSGYVPRNHTGFDRPVSWSRSPAVSASDPAVRLLDADNDGVVDVLASSGDSVAIYYREDPEGWRSTPQLVSRTELPAADLNDRHVFLADMTGSGAVDLVRVDGGGVTYWPALGRGRWDAPVAMANPPLLPFDFVPDRLFLQDIDGDGCADLVYLDQTRLLYWMNQGGNAFSDFQAVDYLPIASMAESRFVDISGIGVNGLLWSATLGGRVAYFFLDFVGGAKPYLLQSLDNGRGLVTSVEYSTSPREAARDRAARTAWASSMPICVPVVSAVARSDQGTGNSSRTEYRYHEGRYDGVLREFAGFGRVECSEVGDDTSPTLLQTTWFHNGLENEVNEPRTFVARMALRAIRGRMYRQERSSPDGSQQANPLFDRLDQTWIASPLQTAAGVVHVPRLSESVRTTFERTPEAVTRHSTTNTAWDANNNVTDSTETSESMAGGEPPHVLRTHCDFALDPVGRFSSLPARTRQFGASDEIIADSIVEYDHAPEGSVGAQGLVTRRSALVLTDSLVSDVYGDALPDLASLGYFRRQGEDGWWVAQASFTRVDDANGLRGTTTDANGATSTYVFNEDRTYPVAVTDPMGNVTSADYDARIARLVQMTDGGGALRTSSYDALARVVSRVEPGDTDGLPTMEFVYSVNASPTSIVRRQRALSGETPMLESRDLYDATGRLVEQRETDDDGEVAVLSRRYSSRGHLARVWQPFRRDSAEYSDPGAAAPSTSYQYDALGRTLQVVNPDGSFRTMSYGPLLVTEADEEDNNPAPGAAHRDTPTRRQLDATGRVVRIEQNLSGRTLASTYAYDIKGNLIRHTDESGNVVEFSYDLLGRQLRVRRPERDSRMLRDPAGRPVESRVAGADAVFREYDALARLTALRIGARQAVPLQTFVYHDAGSPMPSDAGANTAGGRLVRVDDETGTTIFDYDVRGRQTHRRWQGTGRDSTLEVDAEFRSDGRLAAITYPDAGSGRRRVESSYDRRGRLVSVTGVVPSIQNDVDGAIAAMQYANGTQLTAVYDATMRRTVSRAITSPAGWQRATDYSWDKVGNLLAIGSTDDKLAAVYTYDDLYRLINAHTPLGEQFQYRYADNGAITFKSDVGEYRYGEAGAAPTCATTAGTDSLAYSPTGEMSSAPWGDQTFDALGRLRRIARDGSTIAEYVYDWKGRRVSSTIVNAEGNASSRLTPDPWYSIEGEDLVLNLFAGDQIVARESSGGTTFLHFDHLGGLVATSDDAGALIETLRYDPFGRLVERIGPASQAIGFTGGEFDVTTQLLYLQARYYHTVLGIFISVDPIVQDPLMPIAWAGYAYCGNNPTTRIDPSGTSFNLVKFTVGVLAVVALTAALVVSAGALAPAEIPALAAEQEMAGLYVAFGELTGGAVGGITVAKEESQNGRSPDFWDVALGAVVGAAVSGWATYATVYGQAAPGKLTGEGVGNALFGGKSDLVSGALNNAVTQTATGFAHAVARPIAGTGGLDRQFSSDLFQSFIAGAASGYLQGAIIGPIIPPKTAWHTDPWEAIFHAGITSMEQVATSQIEWHHVFIKGTAENASLGSGLDVAAAFAAVKVGFG